MDTAGWRKTASHEEIFRRPGLSDQLLLKIRNPAEIIF
jgi:hypothetical protein